MSNLQLQMNSLNLKHLRSKQLSQYWIILSGKPINFFLNGAIFGDLAVELSTWAVPVKNLPNLPIRNSFWILSGNYLL